jgi:hypothetical protein
MAWNLGQECEVYNAKLFALYKALEIGNEESKIKTLDLWIFSDSQACLKSLKIGINKANQALHEKIYEMAKKIKDKSINVHFQWVPGHMGIYGNELADEAAKYGADWVEPTPNKIGLSISFLNRKLKEKVLSNWQNIWQKSSQNNQYKQFNAQPKLKANQLKIDKLTWSTMMQLKLAHGYFRSYLTRLPDYDNEICPDCLTNQKQTPYHLLLQCPSQSENRKNTIGKLNRKDQTLNSLFLTKIGQEKLILFLKKSKIATRKWLLGHA